MQRGDHRLRGVLDSIEDLGKIGRGGGLAEFGYVGAGDEGPPVADDDDRLDRAVRLGLIDAPIEAVADGLRQGVHRRGVDRDQSDLALNRKVGDRIDGRHLIFSLKSSRPMLMPFPEPRKEADASPKKSADGL